MSIQQFCVKFDRPGATYAPGETVTGTVDCVLSKPKDFKEIVLKVVGKAETCWTESKSDMNNDSTTEWHGTKESYFKQSNRVIGSGIENEKITLPVGHHFYPFSYQLPVNIPNSFEHRNGKVRYTIKAILNRPCRIDRKINSAFTVVTPYDINPKQGFISHIREEFVHQFHHFGFVNAGVMNFSVGSGASRFVTGDTIEVTVKHAASSTKVDIMLIKLKLIQKLTFYDKTGQFCVSEALQRVGKSGPYDKKGETSLKLVIPEMPLLNLQHCSIIDFGYELVLSIKFFGFHRKIERFYPVYHESEEVTVTHKAHLIRALMTQ